MEQYADSMDRAAVESERLLEEQLRVARSTQPTALPCIGECHNCGEGLEPGHRFCDSDCRDDFEKIQRSRSHQAPPRR